MAYDRFMIAPINIGLETDLKPWLIPDEAFAQLTNAYVFRGRVRKRFGGLLMGTGATSTVTAPLLSRLRINVGTTDGSGDLSGIVPGDIFKIGQMFSIGSEIFTVVALGTPGVMLDTGASTTHTYDTTTGAFVFTGAAALSTIYFYPAEPVMGLTNYEFGPINNQPSYAFDTQFAYVFATTSWQRSVTGGVAPVWHGGNLDFFWASNWYGLTANIVILFVTNFQAHIASGGIGELTDDPIWSLNNTTGTPVWTPYSYSPDVIQNPTNTQPYTVTKSKMGSPTIIGSYVQTARIVVAFKDRLLLLNTIENNANGAIAFDPMNPTTTGITPTTYATSTNTAFPQRCRYSHNGSPFTDNAFLEPNQIYKNGSNAQVSADGAGFIDATTEEQIISAEFIKDRLIVYFERSTWELAYTGNQVLPFVWQKINTELGSEATFSTVPFDKVILSIGNTGVHACNGANVERIDNKIPDEIFKINNKNEGVKRIAGIRDYYVEMVYWTFPSTAEEQIEIYPNQVLVYNYKTGSWALNDDCITTFGYFEQQLDTTWEIAQGTWQEANFTWDSGVTHAQFRQVIAGNQQGYVYLIIPDESSNPPVMQITNMTYPGGQSVILTVIDHTLTLGDYVAVENAQGVTGINDEIYQVSVIVDKDTVRIFPASFTGTYTGGGTLRRVSNIQILSKQWNPYVNKSRNVYLAKIDFCVERTADGQVTVDYYPSYTSLSMIDEGTATNTIMGTGVLETNPYPDFPLEVEQDRLWHPVYFQTQGESVQIFISLSDEQIRNPEIAFEDFQLEGLVLYTQPTTSRLQ